jgi:hypothetical protein
MPLTDTTIKDTKPSTKPRKLYDSDGLYLLVTPTGKLWRYKYRVAGREKLLSLGADPAVKLKAARAKRDDLRKQLAAASILAPRARQQRSLRPKPLRE